MWRSHSIRSKGQHRLRVRERFFRQRLLASCCCRSSEIRGGKEAEYLIVPAQLPAHSVNVVVNPERVSRAIGLNGLLDLSRSSSAMRYLFVFGNQHPSRGKTLSHQHPAEVWLRPWLGPFAVRAQRGRSVARASPRTTPDCHGLAT